MNFIEKFWSENANKYKGSHWASWGDNFSIDLEIGVISRHINNGYMVLDVGCANGYSTFKQKDRHSINIVGVDFCYNMVKVAHERMEKEKAEGISFIKGDVRCLPFENDLFDVTYTTRTLINLPTWKEQMKGVEECLRVTRPGGKVILSEGFAEPLFRLNSLRALCNLSPLYEHDFNRYLKQELLEAFLEEKNIYKFKSEEFSSTYYLGSRFLRELEQTNEKYEGYSNPINKEFFELQSKFKTRGFGIQIAYVINK